MDRKDLLGYDEKSTVIFNLGGAISSLYVEMGAVAIDVRRMDIQIAELQFQREGLLQRRSTLEREIITAVDKLVSMENNPPSIPLYAAKSAPMKDDETPRW